MKIWKHSRPRPFATLFVLLCCLALLPSAMAQDLPPMPPTKGESLAGHPVVLPDAASGKVAVLIFGFSKASKGPTSAWASKFQIDLGTRPDFEVYQLPVLEAVPRLIRGMIISGMKKDVPENKRDHFVPILQGEDELKKFVHYNEPDDAYLVVLNRSGKPAEMTHGAASDASYAQLRSRIESVLNQK